MRVLRVRPLWCTAPRGVPFDMAAAAAVLCKGAVNEMSAKIVRLWPIGGKTCGNVLQGEFRRPHTVAEGEGSAAAAASGRTCWRRRCLRLSVPVFLNAVHMRCGCQTRLERGAGPEQANRPGASAAGLLIGTCNIQAAAHSRWKGAGWPACCVLSCSRQGGHKRREWGSHGVFQIPIRASLSANRLQSIPAMEGGFLPSSEPLPPRYASTGSWSQAAGQRGTQPAPPAQQARVQRPAAAAAAAWDGGEPPDLELEAQGGCSRCPSLSFRSDWLKAFGVVLCNTCSKEERLISKVRLGGQGCCFSFRPLPTAAGRRRLLAALCNGCCCFQVTQLCRAICRLCL